MSPSYDVMGWVHSGPPATHTASALLHIKDNVNHRFGESDEFNGIVVAVVAVRQTVATTDGSRAPPATTAVGALAYKHAACRMAAITLMPTCTLVATSALATSPHN